MKEPLRGKELLRAALNQIISYPETWDQTQWHCKSTHCLGGWCQLLGGFTASGGSSTHAEARLALDISGNLSAWLFDYSRTLNELHTFARGHLAGNIDRDGYDQEGYFRDGYNRDGYDRNGYDRYGYDHGGFRRDGYNQFGYDVFENRLPLL